MIAASLCCFIGLACLPSDANRVGQVNSRLENQSGRSTRAATKGKTSPEATVRADEAQYRMSAEQQNMRSRHGGRLTKRDQRRLNRQLNRNSNRMRNSTK